MRGGLLSSGVGHSHRLSDRQIISSLTFVATHVIVVLSLQKGGVIIGEQKKMGRPTDNPKTTMFRVRLDDGTIEMLDESADALNITKSAVVRKGIEMVYKSLKK